MVTRNDSSNLASPINTQPTPRLSRLPARRQEA